MHFRLAKCFVLLASFAFLTLAAQSAAPANQNQQPRAALASGQTDAALPQSGLGDANAASCTLPGRPCNPKASTCCGGYHCVFSGGSTRVGYACKPAARVSANSSNPWEESNLNRLDLVEIRR